MKTYVTSLVIAFSVLTTGCGREVVKIGVVAPMSGTLGQYGRDMANGAKLAADELNNGDFRIDGKQAKFEIVVDDDKASPEEGKAAAKRLIDAGVAGVFGHFNSGVSIPAAPIYAAAGIPQISVSTNPKYTRMGLKTTFRITADDVEQGSTLGRLASDKLHAKHIYLVDDKTTFGTGLVAEIQKVFKTKGVSALHESVSPQSPELPALLQKFKDNSTDMVIFAGDEALGIPLLSAASITSPETCRSKCWKAARWSICTMSAKLLPDAASAASNFRLTILARAIRL